MLSEDKLVLFKLINGEGGVKLQFTLKNECPIFSQDVPSL